MGEGDGRAGETVRRASRKHSSTPANRSSCSGNNRLLLVTGGAAAPVVGWFHTCEHPPPSAGQSRTTVQGANSLQQHTSPLSTTHSFRPDDTESFRRVSGYEQPCRNCGGILRIGWLVLLACSLSMSSTPFDISVDSVLTKFGAGKMRAADDATSCQAYMLADAPRTHVSLLSGC
jgi:hypothetical protein